MYVGTVDLHELPVMGSQQSADNPTVHLSLLKAGQPDQGRLPARRYGSLLNPAVLRSRFISAPLINLPTYVFLASLPACQPASVALIPSFTPAGRATSCIFLV